MVIGKKEEGEFSLHLVCDIEHSSHPATLPLHGWTQVMEDTYKYTQSLYMYYTHACICPTRLITMQYACSVLNSAIGKEPVVGAESVA